MPEQSWLDRYNLRERMQRLDEELLYHPDPPPARLPWYQRIWVQWHWSSVLALILTLINLTTLAYQLTQERHRARFDAEIAYRYGIILGQHRVTQSHSC